MCRPFDLLIQFMEINPKEGGKESYTKINIRISFPVLFILMKNSSIGSYGIDNNKEE